MKKHITAVGAHPDDIESGVGGLLARHISEGDEVHILVLSRGEAGGTSTTGRVAEAQAAATSIGATFTQGLLPDTLISEKMAIDLIEADLARFPADVAYIHSAHDTHQDHRAAAYASRVAFRRVPQVFAYQTPSSTDEFTPARFPDITGYLGAKLEMITHHVSQKNRPYLSDEYVRGHASYWGQRRGLYPYAEPLEVILDRDPARQS